MKQNASQIAQNSSTQDQSSNNQPKQASTGISRSPIVVVGLIIIFIICFICFICLGSSMFLGSLGDVSMENIEDKYIEKTVAGKEESENKLLSIPISGIILTNKDTDNTGINLFSPSNMTYGYQVKKEIMNAANDPNIKGILLNISSPGGTIAGSKAISDGIEYYKNKTKNPVIAYIADSATSGAYYIATSSDLIISDHGTTIGSIGVIFGPFQSYNKVVAEGNIITGQIITQKGIETKYFTAGEYKDIGNPYRQLSKEEITTVQKMINNEYDDFVDHVSQKRNIKKDTIKKNIKALIYGNTQAKNLNLIDKIGNREQAYEELAKKAKIENDYKVIQKKLELGFWDTIFMNSLIKDNQLNTNNTNIKSNINNNQLQIQKKLQTQTLMIYSNAIY